MKVKLAFCISNLRVKWLKTRAFFCGTYQCTMYYRKIPFKDGMPHQLGCAAGVVEAFSLTMVL